MIKRIPTKNVVRAIKTGANVCYFDRAKNRFTTLEKLLETLPGVFVVDEKSLVELFEEEEEKRQPKRDNRKKNLDRCKILTLKQDGWTTKAISEEMGVSPQAIEYHLKKMEVVK